MDGVPLYDVQALLGHESYRTTQRYAHLAPGAHDKVLQSWSRRNGHYDRQTTDGDRDAADAPVTHEEEEPHSSSEE